MSDQEIRLRFSSSGLKQMRDDMKAFGQDGTAAFTKIDQAVAKPNKALTFTVAQLQQVRSSMIAAGNDGSAAFDRIDKAVRSLDPSSWSNMFRQAQQLREALNPSIDAERRFSAAVAEHSRLLGAGLITQAEYTAAVAMARKEFGVAEKAALGLGQGYALTRAQGMELAHSARAIFDSLLAGRNPVQALAMESGRLSQVLGEGRGGVGAAFAALRSLIFSPIGAIVAFTGAALAAIGVEARWVESQESLQRSLMGGGRVIQQTADQLERIAEDGARAGNVSAATGRQMEQAFMATGTTAVTSFGKAIAISRDFAAALGIDGKKATELLAQAMADPAKAADELNEKLHFLSDQQREEIRSLTEAGDRSGAAALLFDQLGNSVAGAAQHLGVLDKALNAVKESFSDTMDAAGRFMQKAAGEPPIGGALFNWARTLPGTPGANAARDRETQAQADAARQRQLDQTAHDNEIGNRAGDAVRKLNPEIDAVRRLRAELGLLQKAQSTGWKGMAPEEVKAAQRDVEALTRAIQTYIPEREKAQKLAEIDAKIAARPGSAERDQLMQERMRAQLAGEVLTQGEVDARVAASGERGFNRGARTDRAAQARLEAAQREYADAMAKDEKANANLVAAEQNLQRWQEAGLQLTDSQIAAYRNLAAAKDDAAAQKEADAAAKSDREWQDALAGVTREHHNLDQALSLVAKRTEEGKAPTEAEIARLIALANAADRAAEMNKALAAARSAVKEASADAMAGLPAATNPRTGKYDTSIAVKQWDDQRVAIEQEAQNRIRAAEQARIDAGEESAQQGAENAARAIQAIDAAYALQTSEQLLAIKKKAADEAVRYEEQKQQELNSRIAQTAADFGQAIMALSNPNVRVGDVGRQLAQEILRQILQTLVADPMVNLIKQALQNLTSGANIQGGGVSGLLGQGLRFLLGGGTGPITPFGSVLSPDIAVASNAVAPLSLNTTLPTLNIPGFAAGTNSTPDGLYWVGEHGPEIMSGSGRSIYSTTNSLDMIGGLQQRAFAAGAAQQSGAGLSLVYAPQHHLSAPGADPAQLKRLEDAFHQTVRQEPQRVAAYLRAAKLR